MSDFLAAAAEASTHRCQEAQRARPLASLRVDPQSPATFAATHFHVFAEIKRTSPAEGTLATDDLAPETLATSYSAGGASALSVLTEPDRFHGSLEDLQLVSHAVPTPVMRKDFLVDPYQIHEAASHGAQGALLIVKIAADQHRAIIDAAATTGCFLLLEAFDEPDMERAVTLSEYADSVGVVNLLGVNCRDLVTLQVDPLRFRTMASQIPTDRTVIAESGIHTAEDARQVAELGYGGALVGTALMRTSEPAALVRALATAGTEVRSPC